MSTITQQLATNNQQFTDYDTSKFLLGDNYFIDGQVTASGADVALLEGMVMGRIASTGKLVPLDSTATDGSQLPVGLVVVDHTVADGSTDTVRLVNKGVVASSKINFSGSETTSTVITITDSVPGNTTYTKTIGDLLNELGLVLESGDELTDYDNS